MKDRATLNGVSMRVVDRDRSWVRLATTSNEEFRVPRYLVDDDPGFEVGAVYEFGDGSGYFLIENRLPGGYFWVFDTDAKEPLEVELDEMHGAQLVLSPGSSVEPFPAGSVYSVNDIPCTVKEFDRWSETVRMSVIGDETEFSIPASILQYSSVGDSVVWMTPDGPGIMYSAGEGRWIRSRETLYEDTEVYDNPASFIPIEP